VLPAADRELVEERHAVAALDCREQGAVARVKILVAAPAVARVIERVLRLAQMVRVTRVDAAEVRQKRDEPPAALVDAVAHGVRAAHLFPGENLFGLRFRQARGRGRRFRRSVLSPSPPVIAGRLQVRISGQD